MSLQSISLLDFKRNYNIEFEKWKFFFSFNFDNIMIKVADLENLNEYKNCFYFYMFVNNSLFKECNNNQELIDIMLMYINQKKIRIEEDILSINVIFDDNFSLLLIKKQEKDITNISIEILLSKINKFELEIVRLKNIIENNQNLTNQNINTIKEEIKEQNTKINNRVENLEKICLKNNGKEKKDKDKKKVTLKEIKTINPKENILSISQLSKEEIITTSSEKSIKIYDLNFNIIQNITNAHDNWIYNISVKDKDNFATCSSDKSIKIWNRENDKFILKEKINAHKKCIKKIIFKSNGILISSSFDTSIKIWEKKNDTYSCIKKLSHTKYINSLLYINDNDILVSSGIDGTKFWNFLNYELLFHIKQAECHCWYALEKVDNDTIIVGGIDGNIKVISIVQKKIIQEIYDNILCNAIIKIKNRNFILIGGQNKNKKINIYDSINFQLVNYIDNSHFDDIIGFLQLDNSFILSFSSDKTIKIWVLE